MANQEATNKYSDVLNEAMAMHAAAAVQNLRFNKTEIAEIVDITNRDDGWYTVWNGAIRYQAFSENTAYTVGMQVYVNIPNNDYTGQKTIVSQYKRVGEKGVWYRSPWQDFSPDSENIVIDNDRKSSGADNSSTGQLVANWDLTIKDSGEEATDSEVATSQYIILYQSDDLSYDKNKNNYQNYKYIGIRADFKTLLKAFNVNSGDYGIKVTLTYHKKDEVIDDPKDIIQVVTLSAVADMVGSLYDFNVYYTQEALYELNKGDGSSLNGIKVELYQDGNFLNSDGKKVPFYYTMNDNKYINNPNIFMRNLDIRFGNDPIDTDNLLEIYSTNGLTYDVAQKDSLNSKNIHLRWTHVSSMDNKTVTIEDSSTVRDFEELRDYKIHWYKDTIHTNKEYLEILEKEEDKYKEQSDLIKEWKNAEANQDDISKNDLISIRKKIIEAFNLSSNLYNEADNFSITQNGEAQIERSARIGKNSKKASDILAGEFWEPIDDNDFTISFIPDKYKEKCKIMAIVEYGPVIEKDGEGEVFDTTSRDYHMIKSNVLELSNGTAVPDIATIDNLSGLKIRFKDNSDGNYPLYSGITNEILNRSDITKTRELEAVYKSISSDEYFNGNETIIWKIPVINTMIVMSKEFYDDAELILNDGDSIFTEYNATIGEFDSDYIYIKRVAENDDTKPVVDIQKYQIEKFYKKSAVNNTVTCFTIKNNQMTKASVTMYFSQHGTSGTDYTFYFGLGSLYEIGDDNEWIEVGPPDTAITLGDTRYREIVFDLYDSKNERIELTDDQKNDIIESWIAANDNGYYNKGQIGTLITNGKQQQWDNNVAMIQYKTIAVSENESNQKYIRFAIRANSENNYTFDDDYKNLLNDFRIVEEEAQVLYKRIKNEEKIANQVKQKKAVLSSEYEGTTDEEKKARLAEEILRYQNWIDSYETTKNNYNRKIADVESKRREVYESLQSLINSYKSYLEPFRYIILKAGLWSNIIDSVDDSTRKIKFEQYLPLHFRAKDSLWCLQGSDTIIYDDKGTNPYCENDVYKLIDGETGITVPVDTKNALIRNLHIYVDDNEADEQTITNWNYPYFKLVAEKDGTFQKLIIPSLYLSNQSKNICIEVPGLYTCPLLVIQNKYQIPALNEWDGELLVDSTKNEVLAAMIGAGHKDTDNTFTGVVMGDVKQQDNNNQIVKTTGLFGYDKGERIFELNTNGEAFIGKSGNGRIYINGTSGTIKSAAREASNTKGTEFNLKENYIDVRSNDDNNFSRIHLDVTTDTSKNDTGAYFSIDSNNGNRLIHIANNDYYLQTEDYTGPTGTTGLRIDLKEGTFDSKGKLTIAGNSNSSITFGNAFKVEKNPDGTNGGSGMAVSLGNLNFIDSNGNFMKEGTGSDARTATNIKPKWMTFVTDIQGSVSRSFIPITASVSNSVNIDYRYETSYTYPTTTTTTVTKTFQTTKGAALEHYEDNGGSLVITSEGTGDLLVDGREDTEIFRNTVTVTGLVNGTGVGTKEVTDNITVPYTATWTGQSNAPYVDNITLTVTKVSMWALTNESTSSKTITIQ